MVSASPIFQDIDNIRSGPDNKTTCHGWAVSSLINPRISRLCLSNASVVLSVFLIYNIYPAINLTYAHTLLQSN
ncbi:hypothetical protein BC937DRAFT_90494 [Endogone sp. FLAS-F59071]|nr:hypothetical protein BC937DRAFT_90494 [Endogone sp. FLAS-F59071]|eukprot:RUS22080.1 hypothetical protein BC937DRAFT_90494 [Endogone sp. FLAS-F59071]